jgi:uncharacterized protein YndB with AHSA1/START domain
MVFREPDLSSRPFDLTVERDLPAAALEIYDAWLHQLDRWFAAPGSMLLRPEVGEPFFFETEHRPEASLAAQRHPHYGRFLRLVPDRLIQLTWVTGAGGTEGAETVVMVELEPRDDHTRLRLTHAGFATAAARDQHEQAWPLVLDRLSRHLSGSVPD